MPEIGKYPLAWYLAEDKKSCLSLVLDLQKEGDALFADLLVFRTVTRYEGRKDFSMQFCPRVPYDPLFLISGTFIWFTVEEEQKR